MTDVASQGSRPDDERPVLTNRQGHPVYDNQNQRTVGARGPATLENYQFLEKISHFDRERIPERVVHARGTTAFGYFEAYGSVGRRADLGATPARSCSRRRASAPSWPSASRPWPAAATPPKLVRDPRGFAVKFYTEDGNWDLVGNNLGRVLHPRRDQVPRLHPLAEARPGRRSSGRSPTGCSTSSARPRSRCTWSRWCSARAASRRRYRTMQGFGVNTYKWVNAAGRDQAGQVPLDPQAGRQVADRGPGGRDPGQRARLPHQGPLRRRSSAATTRSGSCTCS